MENIRSECEIEEDCHYSNGSMKYCIIKILIERPKFFESEERGRKQIRNTVIDYYNTARKLLYELSEFRGLVLIIREGFPNMSVSLEDFLKEDELEILQK